VRPSIAGWPPHRKSSFTHSRCSPFGAAEARTLLGDFANAEILLDHLEQQGSPADSVVLGYAAALRTRVAVLRDDSATAIEHGERALQLLPAEDTSACASALVEPGSARLLAGQLDKADMLLHEGLTLARQAMRGPKSGPR